MKKKLLSVLFLISLSGSLGFSWPFSWLFPHPNHEPFGTSQWLEKQMSILRSQSSGLDDNILRLSLMAYIRARQQGYDHKELLTIIDYSKPSTEKRLWIFDL